MGCGTRAGRPAAAAGLDRADAMEGSALPAMISKGGRGHQQLIECTCSRSRATDMAVSIIVWISVRVPIMRNHEPTRLEFGLYQRA